MVSKSFFYLELFVSLIEASFFEQVLNLVFNNFANFECK